MLKEWKGFSDEDRNWKTIDKAWSKSDNNRKRDGVNVLIFFSFQSCCFSFNVLKDKNKQGIIKTTKQPQTVSKVPGIYKKLSQIIAWA